jgi:hypothetical protein
MLRCVAALCVVIWYLPAYAEQEPGMELLDGKLSLDVDAWSTAHFYRFTSSGLSSNDATFERVVALVGLTGRISPVVSIRACFDVGGYWGGPALDMYADFAWRSGFGARVGQFLPPLGFEFMTDYVRQPLVNNSLLQTYVKANGGRDIGAMASWQNERLSFATALLTGAGANAGDNNNKKDLCARLTVRPLATDDAVFALRGYYGWPDWSDTAWSSVAAEARLRGGSLEVQAEFQNHYGNDVRNNAAYLQAAWGVGRLQPVARLDLILPQGEHPEWMVTGGLNLQLVPDHLKVMFDCTYRREYQTNWSVFGFLLRLQALL